METSSTREAAKGQQVVLAINRSDYMLDEPSSKMLQVCSTSNRCESRWLA